MPEKQTPYEQMCDELTRIRNKLACLREQSSAEVEQLTSKISEHTDRQADFSTATASRTLIQRE